MPGITAAEVEPAAPSERAPVIWRMIRDHCAKRIARKILGWLLCDQVGRVLRKRILQLEQIVSDVD